MIINFHNNLYKKKAIKSAATDYKELADFDISENKNYIQVELKNINNDVKNSIKDEFCNYVLHKSRR